MKSSVIIRSSRRSTRSGFTLMEMIIVLTIIALLVALAMNSLTGVGETAKGQKAAADISAFKTALLSYQLQCGTLPTTEQGLKALWARPTSEPVPARWTAQFSDEQAMDPWNHPYQYVNPGKHNPNGFDVFSMGPDGVAGTSDDIGNWKDDSTTSSQ